MFAGVDPISSGGRGCKILGAHLEGTRVVSIDPQLQIVLYFSRIAESALWALFRLFAD